MAMEAPTGIRARHVCGAKLLLVGVALAVSAGAGTQPPDFAPHQLGRSNVSRRTQNSNHARLQI
jgi:hypothetical protein